MGECADRKTLVTEAISRIKKKVVENDREECERLCKESELTFWERARIRRKSGKVRYVHTVPILISCGYKNVKERLEGMLRKAGLVASFQWPKECMEFVDKIHEKVETMGFSKTEYYTRVRPARVEGRVFLRVETKRKEEGKFKGLAYWRAPPRDKEY